MKTVIADPIAGHTLAKAAPVLFMALDHRHAHLLLDGPDGLKKLNDVRSPRMRGARYHTSRGNVPGRGEKRFHQVRQEETKRHFERAMVELEAAFTRERAIGVILVGEHHTVAEFQHGLPGHLAARVLRTMPMDIKALKRRVMREAAEESRHFTPSASSPP